MIAASLARALAARRIHYGWLMVSLVFLYGVCSSAADERSRRAADADFERSRLVDR